jgi:hypothetical protein
MENLTTHNALLDATLTSQRGVVADLERQYREAERAVGAYQDVIDGGRNAMNRDYDQWTSQLQSLENGISGVNQIAQEMTDSLSGEAIVGSTATVTSSISAMGDATQRSGEQARQATSFWTDFFRTVGDYAGQALDLTMLGAGKVAGEGVEQPKMDPLKLDMLRQSQQEAISQLQADAEAAREAFIGPLRELAPMMQDQLGMAFSAMGRFIGGTKSAFADLGKAIASSLSNTFGSIGQSFLTSAMSIVTGASSGPLGIFLALGGAFSMLSGLLSGSGGGAAVNRSMATSPDVLTAIRPEVSGSGRTVIHQTLSIGAVFADYDESATRAVARYSRRAQAMGEL